jgi:hypothetical protein
MEQPNGDESQSQENAKQHEDRSSGNASTTAAATLTLVDPSCPPANSSTSTSNSDQIVSGPNATTSFLGENHAAPTNPQ